MVPHLLNFFESSFLACNYYGYLVFLMDDFFAAREYGWTKSSDSDEIDSDYRSSDDEDVPFA